MIFGLIILVFVAFYMFNSSNVGSMTTALSINKQDH